MRFEVLAMIFGFFGVRFGRGGVVVSSSDASAGGGGGGTGSLDFSSANNSMYVGTMIGGC